jgi:hypothetical protein
VGDNKGEESISRPANQVDKRFSAVSFIDDIVNHNVEHRFFLYFVFKSLIFRVERTYYYSCPVAYERRRYRGDLVQVVTRLVRKASG